MKVSKTSNYSLFHLADDGSNRIVRTGKHKKLFASMKLRGFMPECPIIVETQKNGLLRIFDGQHRFVFAKEIGLPVYYVEKTSDIDVTELVGTAVPWDLVDYAQRHATNGVKSYQDALAFMECHRLPITVVFCLLSGTATFGNFKNAFTAGSWKIKDWAWANAVIGIYGPLSQMSAKLCNRSFQMACMAVCRVKDFEPAGLLKNARKCQSELKSYSTKLEYLEMLERVYNYRRSNLVGLKNLAIMAMKDRNPKLAKAS